MTLSYCYFRSHCDLQARLMECVEAYYAAESANIRAEVAESIRLQGNRGKSLIFEAAMARNFYFPIVYVDRDDFQKALFW